MFQAEGNYKVTNAHCKHFCILLIFGVRDLLRLPMVINCVNCKTEFNVKPSQYALGQRCCTKACSLEYRAKRNSVKMSICKLCGNQFEQYLSDIERGRKYCSRDCYYKARLTKHIDGDEAFISSTGYRFIYINGYPIREHIHVMEKVLSRKLQSCEHVHHINFDRLDNRLENLMLLTKSEHKKLHWKLSKELNNFIEKGGAE
jgi:hypothetical protein